MRLVDCFMGLIIYVVHTVRHFEKNQLEFQEVKSAIDGLLAQSQKIKEKSRFSDQNYNYARLSICVWIDEAILNSAWTHKLLWQKELLQRRYYNITDGGMEFFERLDKLGHEERDVREVAYYCLTLGLAGRYVGKGDGVVLDHLKTSNLKRLYGSSAGEPTLENRQLFPEAYQKNDPGPPPGRRGWSWRTLPLAVGLLCVGLFAGLMIVYQYLLKMDLSRFSPL